MKVDAVLQYFEEADLEAAKVILHIANKTLEKRSGSGEMVVKRKRRTMSAEGRQRIADAQKARHAAAREQTEAPKKGRKTNSSPFEHSEETKEALA